jgi:hypothetical protein
MTSGFVLSRSRQCYDAPAQKKDRADIGAVSSKAFGLRGESNSLLVVIGVFVDELFPLGREVFEGEDRLDRALVDAQAAVDTGVWVDVELVDGFKVAFVFAGVDAVDRANRDARRVFGSDAGLRNDVGHEKNLLTISRRGIIGQAGGLARKSLRQIESISTDFRRTCRSVDRLIGAFA